MPVTASDIVFFPGVRIGDEPNSGGPPRYWPLPDGVTHNLFAGITAAQRNSGFTSCRKIIPGLENGDTAGLTGALAYLAARPTETDVDSVLFAKGGHLSVRELNFIPYSGVSALAKAGYFQNVDPFAFQISRDGLPKGQVTISTGPTTLNVGDALMFVGRQSPLPPGVQDLRVLDIHGTAFITALISTGTSYSTITRTVEVEFIYESGEGPVRADSVCRRVEPAVTGDAAQAVSVAGVVSAAGTIIEVDRVMAQAAPYYDTALTLYPPAATIGIDATDLIPWNGQVPIFRRTGQVLIGGEIATIARVGFDGRLHLTAALSGGGGATVHGLVPVASSLASSADVLHSQRTWTRVFADELIGPAADVSMYNDTAHPIAVSNYGCVEQRWAIVFGLDPTEFVLIGETLGQIASGDTSTNLSPINAATGTPYFTLAAAGWQAGIDGGNCLRFNTTGAISPTALWVTRCNPENPAAFISTPDSVTVALRDGAGTTGTVELPWIDSTALGGAGTPPPAPPSVADEPPAAPPLSPGGSIPAQASYRTLHTMTVVDEATSAVLQIERLTISIEDGSVCWTLSATGGEPLYALFAESPTARLVRVTIDGIEWLFIVESASRSRNGPAASSVTLTGRSAAMAAGEPYAQPRHWISNGAITAAQLAVFSQEGTGTTVQWYLTDWLIADKVLTFFGSALALVQRIGETVQAQVVCDRVANTIYVSPRYPRLPYEWPAATPDVTIAPEAMRSDSFQRADKPAYNSVYVSGQQQGVIGQVFLAGTDGAAQAPLVTDLLITDAPAVRQRGRAILGAGGPQARVSIVLPVMTGASRPGVLSPGQLARVDETVPWFGMVRAVLVSVAVSAADVEIQQTVVLERHFATP